MKFTKQQLTQDLKERLHALKPEDYLTWYRVRATLEPAPTPPLLDLLYAVMVYIRERQEQLDALLRLKDDLINEAVGVGDVPPGMAKRVRQALAALTAAEWCEAAFAQMEHAYRDEPVVETAGAV